MSASEKIMERSRKSVEITDSLGRKIVLRKPSRLDFGEFLAALGPESSNEAYLGWMIPTLFVFMINGDVVLPPDSKKNILGIFSELGDEGHEAVTAAISEHFPNFLSSGTASPQDLKKK